jgi:hypothetical protein
MDYRTDAEFYNVTIDLTPRTDIAPLNLPAKPTLEQVQTLQMALAEMPNQWNDEPNHYFAEGMYGRELAIPANTVVVGKIHRHEHLVMLVKGDVTISTEHGMKRMQAPHVWVSRAGEKRALFTHADCVFVTVHLNASNTTDLVALEDEIIVPEPQLTQDRPELSAFADELQGVYA